MDSVSYKLPDGRDVAYFENGIFECFNHYDFGWRCCAAYLCSGFCCMPIHSRALGWVNADLGKEAKRAWCANIAGRVLNNNENAAARAIGRLASLRVRTVH